jgi:hypothetical protein
MTATRKRKAEPVKTTRKKSRPRTKLGQAADPMVAARMAHAARALEAGKRLHGARSKRVSVRVDPGLIEAAKAKSGLASDSDVINAALAVIAAPDDFGSWFIRQAGTLPEDFELAI